MARAETSDGNAAQGPARWPYEGWTGDGVVRVLQAACMGKAPAAEPGAPAALFLRGFVNGLSRPERGALETNEAGLLENGLWRGLLSFRARCAHAAAQGRALVEAQAAVVVDEAAYASLRYEEEELARRLQQVAEKLMLKAETAAIRDVNLQRKALAKAFTAMEETRARMRGELVDAPPPRAAPRYDAPVVPCAPAPAAKAGGSGAGKTVALLVVLAVLAVALAATLGAGSSSGHKVFLAADAVQRAIPNATKVVVEGRAAAVRMGPGWVATEASIAAVRRGAVELGARDIVIIDAAGSTVTGPASPTAAPLPP